MWNAFANVFETTESPLLASVVAGWSILVLNWFTGAKHSTEQEKPHSHPDLHKIKENKRFHWNKTQNLGSGLYARAQSAPQDLR